MKCKTSVGMLLATALVLCAMPAAADMSYTQVLEHNQLLGDLFNTGDPYSYYHDNPAENPLGPFTSVEYQALGDQITEVSLAFNFINLLPSAGEYIDIEVDPVGAQGFTYLGRIAQNGRTEFNLQDVFGPAGGLDGLPIEVRFSGPVWMNNSATLVDSSLTVSVIPVPGAMLLGAIGLGAVAWVRRRK